MRLSRPASQRAWHACSRSLPSRSSSALDAPDALPRCKPQADCQPPAASVEGQPSRGSRGFGGSMQTYFVCVKSLGFRMHSLPGPRLPCSLPSACRCGCALPVVARSRGGVVAQQCQAHGAQDQHQHLWSAGPASLVCSPGAAWMAGVLLETDESCLNAAGPPSRLAPPAGRRPRSPHAQVKAPILGDLPRLPTPLGSFLYTSVGC